MTAATTLSPNSELDLVLERTINASPATVWRCLTDAEHVKQWWAPRPWKVVQCEVDLRPGGIFRFDMRSPDESQSSDNLCCFLEVEHGKRIVWTNALIPEYRPATDGFVPFFSAVVTIRPEGKGTHYHVRVMHRDEAGRDRHLEMGFHEGWGTVLNQMVELAEHIA